MSLNSFQQSPQVFTGGPETPEGDGGKWYKSDVQASDC